MTERRLRILPILITSLITLTLTGVVNFAPRAETSRLETLRPEIRRLSFTRRADSRGLVVRLHSSAKVKAFSNPDEPGNSSFRIILFRTDLRADATMDTPEYPVRSYKVNAAGGNVELRFVLVEKGLSPQIYRDRDSNDILISLQSREPDPEVSTHSGTAAEEVSPPGVTTALEVSPSKRVGTAHRWKIDTIVIDAGHGGQDTGAKGYHGVLEKNVVLAVAKKVGVYLREKAGVKVIFTRSDDRFITLRDRGRIANEEGGKLFVSIHANAARDRRARGTETYFLGMHKSDAARTVMNRENEVIRFESDPTHYDDFKGSGLVRQVLAQSAYMRWSERLAGLLEKDFSTRVRRESRSVKQAGFYVLWNASMPAVLVELGFVTNPGEAKFLSSKNGQTYMASAIFRAIRDYKHEYEAALQLASR
jgi:N-acetylmuramoyl-L-alanine amidase